MAHTKSVLPFGSQERYQRLTIQVIVTGHYVEPLKSALLIENKQNHEDRLQFIFCEHVEEVIGWMAQCGHKPDYIVLVVDPRMRTACEMVEENISKIDPHYITGGRLCLVNGDCYAKPSEMGIGQGHLNILSQKYSVILINGDIMNPDKCLHLASRIIGLGISVTGYSTGIPINLDVPGYDQVFS